MESAPAIGIDLGTTNACVGVFRDGSVEIIANDYGNRTTPSYVAFTNSKRFIGEAAKRQTAANARNTVFDAKRLIGRHFQDQSVQSDMKHWPFEVVEQEGKPRIRVEYKGESRTFYPEQISAMVLAKMKQEAENYLGQMVTKAVVTVPAYFNDSQRKATKDAATVAGLEVLRLINEPTAAAIAYGFARKGASKFSGNRSVLIFDLGGGTFDVSVLTIKQGVLQVLATAGDTHLGGEDFDNRMVNYFVQEFRRMHKKDLTASKKAMRRLRTACENAKRALSSNNQADVDIDCLFDNVDFHTAITRAKFEQLNDDLFSSTLEPVKQALADAGLSKTEVDDIVLVGGSTLILKIQKLLKDFFDGKELSKNINPDEAVAYGAAVQAAVSNGDKSENIRDLKLHDVAPLSLGVNVRGDSTSVVIMRNTAIPTHQSQCFTTTDDYQREVSVKVLEGERPLTKDNHLLGEFELSGLQKTLRGLALIEVTFDIDVDGILKVSSRDKSTGSSKEITINQDRLSRKEITRMLMEAERFKDEDVKQRSRINAKNSMETCVYRIKSVVEVGRSRITENDRKTVLDKVNDALAWLESNKQRKTEDIEKKHKELQKVCDPIVANLN